jgi:hypothetical protein
MSNVRGSSTFVYLFSTCPALDSRFWALPTSTRVCPGDIFAAMKWLLAGILAFTSTLSAQAPSDPLQPVATMKQLMLEVIHPAANNLLFLIHRGGPSHDDEWAEARHSAMTLAESGNLLIMRNRAANWIADAKLLTDVGSAAYNAAEARNPKRLESLADRIDASCTTCHKHFRPELFTPNR